MRYKVFSIRDRAADLFCQPFYSHSTGAAVRSFTDEINNPQGNFYKHPEDYDLYELGTFDDEFGQFTTDNPRQVCVGKDVAVKVNS